ncbi:MAG: methyltransferase domain-containing protein [Actinobacteria bacterium]|nr:methyltransferase domain-containing protein [Actinomycetota bacterium]
MVGIVASADDSDVEASVDPEDARRFGLRIWMGCLATQELIATYLGVRLGLYNDLAARGPATAPELAARTGTAQRYVREWLEQQAVAGVLAVDDVAKPADARVFALPPAHAEVLTLSDSPFSIASLAVLPLGGVAGALPALLDAFQTGAGVPDDAYGEDWRHGHGGANRGLFVHGLGRWLVEALPDVHLRLSAPGARAVDVGCGSGWAAVALAQVYPMLAIDGFDLDAGSIELARRHAADAGVADRVRFEVRDASGDDLAGRYDLVCLFDALHEMAEPVAVLRTCRRLRADGGTVLLMDARVAESFVAPAGEVERFQYATSVLHCLPAGLTPAGSSATGTVLRPSMVRSLAVRAGFAGAEVLPIDERFHRFYRLVG